ncbi:lipoyl(octanoyl) transferase LipB [Gilvimarinus chinensis]|uniref:lipoyl(octanoyl) transferase LipB n=1 Tax=Gilvimarinus chinensis TaxID=396005 RepID=UPI00036C05DA|nr:lipoyl(octanoyl) transferase LipB [Gilvimarinus chinensis]
MQASTIYIRQLGIADYETVWAAMSDFTRQRDEHTADEIWVVEHPPVFTQGQAGKPEHLLAVDDIPLVQSDRGGQVTYHGPGQLVVYPLLNLRRLKLGVRDLVTLLEQSLIELLANYGIKANAKPDAPGVYVDGAKIASLGLRVRRGCSFHGLALNVAMDLSPFAQINPCGYQGLAMVDMSRLMPKAPPFAEVGHKLTSILVQKLGDKTGIIPAAQHSVG